MAARSEARGVCLGIRQWRARSGAAAVAAGGDHSGARIRARGGGGDAARAYGEGPHVPGKPFRARRQRHRHLSREFQGTRPGLMADTGIAHMFADLKRTGRKGLIAYLMAGDPTPERTAGLVEALERGGADLIELGVPFSDPIADGPVIQRAGERALRAGTSLLRVLEIAQEIRERSDIPLLLFTYLNPVVRYA